MNQYMKPKVEEFVLSNMNMVVQGAYALVCNKPETFSEQGVPETREYVVDMSPGESFGQFAFTYNTFDVPDQIIVKAGGQVLFTTDNGQGDSCSATSQSRVETLSLPVGSGTVTVEVTTLCDPNVQGTTDFEFTVGCAQNP